MLGAFVTSGLFVGGLAAAGAPVIIHLLARRRFRRIRWAAIDFLVQAERKNRRRLRMEEWILLALRCLAVVMVGTALARPYVSADSLAGVFRGTGRTERIIVLDDSLSTAYRAADGAVFDRAKQAVRRLVARFRSDSPDDTVSLFRTSMLDVPVESGTFLNDAQTEALLARVEALAPSQASLDRDRVITRVAEFLQESSNIINAAIYVISDFQRSTWARRDDSVQSGADVSPALASWLDWAGQDRGLSVVFVNIGEPDAHNLAITSFRLGGGPLVAGTPSAAQIKVANYGVASVESVPLEVSVADIHQEAKSIELVPAGDEVATEVELAFLRAGFEWGRVEIPRDALPEDNVRYFAAEVDEAVRVLVVNGEPAADRFDDEVTFLVTALRPEGATVSGNAPVLMDESEWDAATLDDYHVVILANVYRVSEPMVERLERFVRGGGGLLIFAGDQANADLYNTALFHGGEGLLPVTLVEIGRPTVGSRLVITDRLHPVLRALAEDGDPLGVGAILFHTFWKVEIPASLEAETAGDESAKDALASLAAPANVIARFDDEDRSPAVIERRYGSGRVVFVATSADKEWSNWPDHPTFLPVIVEFTRHVARGVTGSADHFVGDALRIPMDPSLYELDVRVRTPVYPSERETVVTPLALEEGGDLTVPWDRTTEAGLYRFVFDRRDGGEATETVAVNVDPIESDLTAATEDELRSVAGDVPYVYAAGLDHLSADGDAGRRTDLWRYFVLAAIVVLLGEQTLAWAWGRRKGVPLTGVTGEYQRAA